jgi:O-acetyl-ADP-ribose deacetylase (regulator of RNase III)
MKTPHAIVGTDNVYRAMRAALRAIGDNPEIRTVSVSGMGTGVGQMDAFEAARQMRLAVDEHLSAL